MGPKIRVGLLLDSLSLPAWALTAVERLIWSNYAELALIVLNQSELQPNAAGKMSWQGTDHWLYRVFNTIDEKIFLRGLNALTRVDASRILSKVPILEVTPMGEHGEQYFSPPDIEAIASHRLDILVKLGFGNLGGDLLTAASYGVWAYRWGDHRKIEDGLAGYWEVIRGWTETGVALQQLGTADQQNNILFESWLFTYPYSPARNRNCVLWMAASFLSRQVERLHRSGAEKYFHELKNYEDGSPRQLFPNPVPSNVVILWSAVKLAARNLVRVYYWSFFREQWGLLFNFGCDLENDIYKFKKLAPPKDRFWADPHVVYKDSKYYIFMEEFLYQTGKGRISVIAMDRNGKYEKPIPILREDTHLSFPFVFAWMGNHYMIPESSQKGTIDLYECIKFPDQWEFRVTLMKDVHAVDTTVIFLKEKWWLFTAMAEQKAAAPQVELFLFYSDDLFSDRWTPHPMNPIISDAKRARGAGSIIVKEGKLLRPSQDCSKMYGYGFDLNEIVLLSESDYCERTLFSVRPDPAKRIMATHSYAKQADLTVVDALTRLPKWVNAE